MYDAAFYDDNVVVARAAAEVVLPEVLRATGAIQVIDVGCARGAWLAVAKEHGCHVRGFDQYDPDGGSLLEPREYVQRDLKSGVSCRGYDLALCLEVAEHLPATSAPLLVGGLCQARYVLWSAAIPGQRGVDHINEQWPSWWMPFFEAHSFVGAGDLRTQFWDDDRIAPYYRQNLILLARQADMDITGYREPPSNLHHPESQGDEP